MHEAQYCTYKLESAFITAIVEQTGKTAQHPLQVVARAYGIPEEPTK